MKKLFRFLFSKKASVESISPLIGSTETTHSVAEGCQALGYANFSKNREELIAKQGQRQGYIMGAYTRENKQID